MQLYTLKHAVHTALIAGLAASLTACGGGGSDSGSMVNPTTQSANVSMLMSDASSEDWARIQVEILSIALNPQGGGNPVTVYTAPTPVPAFNLVQLDQINEILSTASVPLGTYTSATLTISGNPGDIGLTVSADPESGFAAAPSSDIPSNQIQIQGTHGTSGSLTVPVKVTFDTPFTVSATGSNALDLEFDLGHPAFIVGHTPPGSGMTLWAVNFNGPVRHHPIDDLRHLVLRHLYGNVTAVASDNTSITIAKDLPLLPVANPETAVSTGQSLQILADATNGTIFYDVDAKTNTTIKDFSTEASTLDSKYVRIAARYQEDGTLVAVRIWASSQFDSVWRSPEGHILHVDTTAGVITVLNESGEGVPLTVTADTQFFFRTPANALADATPIGTGMSFLMSHDLVRGFKVHASAVDPLATPMVAQTIDIETAAYLGKISAADSTGFTYTRKFRTGSDDYAVNLDYISSTSANGKDADGNAITGFKYWDFAYPTVVTSGSSAIADFVSATNGGVSFGGLVGAVSAWGASYATWADPANPSGWSLPWSVLEPTPLPLGTVATAFAANSFAMSVLGGASAVTVNVGTAAGSATLVYQVDRTNNVVTVSPIDVTTSGGLASLTDGLMMGAKVKVYGVPESGGTLKAYVLFYFTGSEPGA